MKSRILTLIVTLLALGLALAACVALPYEQPVFEQSRTVGGGVSVNSLTANSIETTDLSADSIATTDLDASGNVIVTGTITGTTFASGPLEMGSIEVFDGGNVLPVGLRGNPGGGLPPVGGDQAYIQMTQAMTDTDGGVLDILGQQGGPASANDGLKGGTIRITGGMGSQLGEGGASSGNGGVVLISGGAKGENGEGAAIDGYVSIGGGWPSEIITPTTDGLFVGGPSEFNDDLLVDGDLTVNGTCTGCGGGQCILSCVHGNSDTDHRNSAECIGVGEYTGCHSGVVAVESWTVRADLRFRQWHRAFCAVENGLLLGGCQHRVSVRVPSCRGKWCVDDCEFLPHCG